jgi:hypothetical protein
MYEQGSHGEHDPSGNLNTSGMHSINFDASNLASGVYIYRIMAGNEFTAIKKMVLVR